MDEGDAAAPEGEALYTAEAVAAIRREADRRVMLAELKQRALAAGMVDLDGLQLLDTSKVRLSDQGDVEVPDGFFEAARRAKPYLFGRPAWGSTARAPVVAPPQPRSAVEMGFEEWQAARAALLRRRSD